MSSINLNRTEAVFASAVRAATGNSLDQRNPMQKGAVITIDMTAVPTVDTVTFTVEGKDPISGKYYTILTSAAIVAVSTVILRVYPALVAIANLTVNDVLPDTWRVVATHSAGTNFTYSVAASYVK